MPALPARPWPGGEGNRSAHLLDKHEPSASSAPQENTPARQCPLHACALARVPLPVCPCACDSIALTRLPLCACPQCNYSPGDGCMIGVLGQNIFKVRACRCWLPDPLRCTAGACASALPHNRGCRIPIAERCKLGDGSDRQRQQCLAAQNSGAQNSAVQPGLLVNVRAPCRCLPAQAASAAAHVASSA